MTASIRLGSSESAGSAPLWRLSRTRGEGDTDDPGRWKLPIIFRLYADPSLRTLQLKRDLPGISQKMLTQHLRELAEDGLMRAAMRQESEHGRQATIDPQIDAGDVPGERAAEECE
ncbi:winged helix-turn-helix transcriptional regulator [Pseudomonas gingeri]|uniref:winged helix-turn-helix transcriptional regulator n=1 Tax=Pseudomonas gingeri TaxID=117681 RepID=UPI001C43281D|nr:helix-turn-helix domain-containing protein [Pseudomonas gingeri]